METLELLRIGHDRIKTGWVKNILRMQIDNVTHYCVIGSLQQYAVYSSHAEATDALVAVMTDAEKALALEEVRAWAATMSVSDLHSSLILIGFNNHPRVKKEDVLSLFERAIASLTPKLVVTERAEERVEERELVDA